MNENIKKLEKAFNENGINFTPDEFFADMVFNKNLVMTVDADGGNVNVFALKGEVKVIK